MSLHALASGTLFRNPEVRTSKNGREFTTATIKVKDGDGFAFVKLLVFSESAQAELARLHDGDAVSAQGALKAETYEKNGEARVSLSIFADHVLPLRVEKKPRPKAEKTTDPTAPPDRSNEPRRLDRHAGDGRDEFGDEIPF